ncbi:MAG: exonuclease [Pseudomonadota bacterium]|nr:exonuclease [Pseudomonadota bacterium]
MAHAVICDCEFLTAEGAPSRFWCGPRDPDPVVAQIGLARLELSGDFAVSETLRLHVIPRDRHGARVALDPLFTRLTSITEDVLDSEGLPLAEALAQVAGFAGDARLWSWGKDEFNMLAISCFVEGIAPPIPATRFANACDLLLAAGMPYEDLIRTRSNTLAAYYKVEHPPLRGHDALDDALGVAYTLQHLLHRGDLTPAAFA